MKKVLVLVLVALMLCGLAACTQSNAEKVAEYIEENRSELVNYVNDGLAEMGIPCTSDVVAQDGGIVVTVKFTGVDDVSGVDKYGFQEALNTSKSSFQSSLTEMRNELPFLVFYTVKYCEEDGDLIAKLTVQ